MTQSPNPLMTDYTSRVTRHASRKLALLVILTIGSSVPSGQVFAGGDERIGTAGAQELRIPVGSRGTALGGAALAAVSGADALYWNPAGLVRSNKAEVLLSHLRYIADMDLNYFAVSSRISRSAALGLSVKILSIGEIIATTEESPDGTGEIFSPHFSVLGVTYSSQLTDRVFFGVTAKVMGEQILTERAWGMAIDLGFQYVPGFRGLRLGIALKQFGPNMRFDGPGLEHHIRLPETDPQASNRTVRTRLASFELPTCIELGAAYETVREGRHKTTAVVTFRSNTMSENEYQAGLEYTLGGLLSLRGGYVLSVEAQSTRSGFAKQFIFGPAFGFGLYLTAGRTEIGLDYAYRRTDFFEDNQWFTLVFAF